MKLISIYKRNDTGYYCAEYFKDNKRKKISLDTKNRSEAEKVWQDFYNKYQENLKKFLVENQVKIDIAFKELFIFKQKRLQLSTYKYEIWKINKFKKFLIEQNIEFISNITPEIIKNFITILENESRSAKTINNYISIVNTILKFFYEKNYISHKIDTTTFWHKREKKRIQIINMEEAKTIIDYCKKIKKIDSRILMLTPFYTGMRYSEIKALNKRNINLEEKYILVNEKQTNMNPQPVQILKSIKAFRKVPILKEYEELLKEYMDIKKDDYLFSNVTYRVINYHCDQINKKLKLPIKFHFHQARHYFASLLIENGISIKKVQTILGHETIETTLNLYSHLIKDWDIEDFNKIKF